MSDDLKPENVELVCRTLGHCLGRTFNRREVDRLIDAARAQGPGPGEAVADGWVMVPRAPTEEMLLRGCKAGLSMATLLDDTRFACERAVWNAMIAATPTREG